MYKILMVDDDKELLKMLKSYFELKGYIIYISENGKEALDKISAAPDIILLDVNMPGIDGIELCRRIRNKVSCPILFLTAKVEEQDRINGLLSGGDDYILKPFSLKELEARIISHLKREERHVGKTRLKFEDRIVIDFLERSVQYESENIAFTKMEYAIVEFLAMNPGQVFDKDRIYEKIWGYDGEGDSRVITELVRRIRNKLQVYTDENLIETVWGSGYRWKK